MKRFAQILFAVLLINGSICLLMACVKEKPACLAPPPSLRFSPLNKTGDALISTKNIDKVTLHYYAGGAYVKAPYLSVNPPLFTNYDLVEVSRATNDTTQFYLSIDDKLLGIIQLKTYKANDPCDSWAHASEVRFNGRILALDQKSYAYTLLTL